jgi:hypothetical protein
LEFNVDLSYNLLDQYGVALEEYDVEKWEGEVDVMLKRAGLNSCLCPIPLRMPGMRVSVSIAMDVR